MDLKRSRLIGLFTATMIGGLALACADSTDPSSNPDTYVLVRVANDPLPAVLYGNEYGAARVLSDTIRLRVDGTGTNSGVREWSGVDPQGPTWSSTEIRHRQVGSYIEIDYVCPPNADCVPPPHLVGHRVAGGLRLRWAPTLRGRSPMSYQRVENDL